jgi:serine/threonine-protein kinase
MVMDWGVAKRVGGAEAGAGTTGVASGATTSPGTVVGTRGFMAPEQARGGLDPVDARADVYGLGALLYLLLTDEVPPADGTAAAVIGARRELPKALRAICARALATAPSGRYHDVKALADDVARYRAGLAVEAHREGLVDRARRVARTYRAAILLVAAYVIMRAVVALLF